MAFQGSRFVTGPVSTAFTTSFRNTYLGHSALVFDFAVFGKRQSRMRGGLMQGKCELRYGVKLSSLKHFHTNDHVHNTTTYGVAS